MHDPTWSSEVYQKDLMQLHNQLVELEKLEIRRARDDISDEEFVRKCCKMIKESQNMVGIIQDRSAVCVSSEMGRLVGYTLDEMIGSPFSRYIHPDELPKVVEYYEKRMSGQEAPIIYETVLMHKNQGSIFVKLITSRFAYLGRPAGYVIIKVMVNNPG